MKLEERKTEVLIVGAGPTGLFLAGLLHKYNVPFHIIDKKSGPSQESRALGIHARTLEIFDSFGLAQKAIEKGLVVNSFSFYKKKKRLQTLDFSQLPSPFPYILTLPQSETEKILIDWLKVGGRSVDWQTELVEMKPFEKGVETVLQKEGGQQKQTYNWVIGCDGAHSKVAEQAGIGFVGKPLEDSFGLVDLNYSSPQPAEALVHFTREGILAVFPLANNQMRFVVNRFDKNNLNEAYWQEVMQKRFPLEAKIESIGWQSHFHVRYSLANQFRKGRIFLCGDAAHIHSPIGGQGMNTGLQDAYNLAWKLATTIAGHAAPSLLNSYEQERMSVVKSVLQLTHIMSHATLSSGLFGFVRTLFLKHILKRPAVQKKIALRLSQLSLNYQSSPMIKECSCSISSQSRRFFRRGPRAGLRAPDAKIRVKDQDSTLFKNLPVGRHLALFFVLDGHGLSEETHQLILRMKSRLHARFIQQVDTALITTNQEHPLLQKNEWEHAVFFDESEEMHRIYHALRPCLYLIRPDRYIGQRCYGFDLFGVKRYLNNIYELT